MDFSQILKSAMYAAEIRDLDLLKTYLLGLVLTLAVWYVKVYLN